jgi:hypothetical protein
VLDRIGQVRVAWSEQIGPDAGRKSQMSALAPGRSRLGPADLSLLGPHLAG